MPPKRKREPATSEGVSRDKRLKSNTGGAVSPCVTRSNSTKGKGTERGAFDATPATSTTPAAPEATKTTEPAPPTAPAPDARPPRKRPRIRKLNPPRPFPTVPPGRSATGPRSTHASPDEPTCICVTRRTTLAAYISRCKAAVLDHGVRELRLCAMGAAIPHLALLVGSLGRREVLPYGEDELKVEVYTGSVPVVDEMLSESEDGDGGEEGAPKEEFRTRVKSVMNVIVRVGDAVAAGQRGGASGRTKGRRRNETGRPREEKSRRIVIQEPEQDEL